MTRINLVAPSELADQHLFAEFREIKMIPKSLNRSLRAAWQREFDKNDSQEYSEQRRMLACKAVLSCVPAEYCLGKGHVSFFYNKGEYLRLRYALICKELDVRDISYNKASELDPDGVFGKLDSEFNRYYMPTHKDLALIRARIAEKIAMKPAWYRWTSTLPHVKL